LLPATLANMIPTLLPGKQPPPDDCTEVMRHQGAGWFFTKQSPYGKPNVNTHSAVRLRKTPSAAGIIDFSA